MDLQKETEETKGEGVNREWTRINTNFTGGED